MARVVDLLNTGLVRPRPPGLRPPGLRPPTDFGEATVIDFDDVADGAVVDAHYVSKGVTFASVTNNPPRRWSAYARAVWGVTSAPNCVSVVAPPALGFFDARQGGVEASFARPQRWVSIDAKIVLPPEFMSTPTARPFLETYNADGKVLGRVYYPLAYGDPGYGSWQTLMHSSTSADIVKVIFSSAYSGPTPVYGLFDQLAFCTKISLMPHPLGA
jgi:hypothetical protein